MTENLSAPPQRSADSARVEAAAARSPSATPTARTRAPWPTTIPCTRLACAPSAIRTPISRVRSATI